MSKVVYADKEKAIETTDNWKPTVLAAGAVIGAAIGLGTAFLLISRVGEDEKLEISPSQGLKMGLAALTFLRQITQIR
ncbi:MAG TPA: hypothetical protein EYP88_05910 [Anaerolineales bacterium]|nr:hypothetical protein [Anaerolineales bacterium]